MANSEFDDDKTSTHVVLSKGTMVSQYRIVEKIGAGGMGVVYLAEDTKLKRQVALKFLPAHMAQDSDVRSRFTREAQATAKLNHPNIVTIYEVSEQSGRPFFAMELVEGQSLGDLLKGNELGIDRIVEIAIQICDGLGAAHDKQIVHRDIKPSNIVIDAYGSPKILDFGLAAIQGGENLTKTGSTLGTIRYMSPEQVRGQNVDCRSDLFSLGVVLYELIAGRTPFERDNEAATLRAITQDNPEPLARYKSDIHAELQRTVSKLLEKNPSMRYQVAVEVLSDLKRLASPSGSSDFITPAKSKSKLPLVLSSLVIITTLLAGVIKFWPEEQVVQHETRMMLAVLPFENLGSEADEYFADGITEEITARLAFIHQFGVIARTSVLQYKGTQKPVEQIGQELGVDYILEGTVRWQKSPSGSDRVRVTPQLIKVSDGTHAWANIYDEAMEEVFAVQSDIATSIAQALGVALVAPQQKAIEDKPTESVEAYDFYLRGNKYYNQSTGGSNERPLRLARQMYQKAIDADPAFITAMARKARTSIELYWHNTHDSADLQESWKIIEQALARDSTSAGARLALGSFYYHNNEYGKALIEFSRVREQQPNNADVLSETAYVYRRQGEVELALEIFRKAAEFDPRSSGHFLDVMYSLVKLHRFDEALDMLERAIVLDPDHPEAYADKAWLYVARDGDLPKARRIISNAMTLLEPNNYFHEIAFRLALWDSDYESALAHASHLRFTSYSRSNHTAKGQVFLQQDKPKLARVYFDSAYAELKQEIAHFPKYSRLHSAMGVALAGLGRFDEAIQEGRRGIELIVRENFRPRVLWDMAYIYLLSGDRESAIDQLETVMALPVNQTAHSLRIASEWRALRDHPRFQALLKKYDTGI